MPTTLFARRAALAVALATSLFSVSALAGECPADKVAPDAVTSGMTEPKGVTDTVLGKIDLSKEKVAAADHLLRTRRLVIQPGGVVPWHNHAERPAIIYVVKGSVVEHRSNCSVPIVHKTGDAIVESGNISHWWMNESSEEAVLTSSDVLHDAMKDDDMM